MKRAIWTFAAAMLGLMLLAIGYGATAEAQRALVSYYPNVGWSISTTYAVGDMITTGGQTYISNVFPNVANNPSSTTTGYCTGFAVPCWTQISGSGGGGGSSVLLIPSGTQNVQQPSISGTQTELGVNAFNGWRNEALFSGSSTAAKTTAAQASLWTTTGTDGSTAQIGPIIIPPYETPYNQISNPMPTAASEGSTCWDFRATSLLNWPAGGSMLSNCSDESAKNWFYFPKRSLLNLSNYTHLSNYSADTLGFSALNAAQIIDGTGPSSTIQANDGFASQIWALQGTNTSSTRTFTTGAELEGIVQGTASNGSSVGTHMDLYNLRSTTWNTYSVDNPDYTNISIGAVFQATSQAFATPLDAASPWHVGRWENIRAEPPLVLQSKMYLKGVSTLTNALNPAVTTYVSGDYFNDFAMDNQAVFICPTANVDCNGIGATPYTVLATTTPLTATLYPTFAGSSGNYYWYLYGNQYSLTTAGNTWFQSAGSGSTSILDTRGGGGEIHDTALTSCTGSSPLNCMIWIRNPSTAAIGTDGTYPRMGYAMDNTGDLLFYNPFSVSFTGSISGTTLTVTGAPTGGALAIGQVVTPGGTAYGANAYGTITALGTGTGGAGTYTLNTSATVSSTSLVALGATNVAALSAAGKWTAVAGFVTGAASNLAGVTATAITNTGTTNLQGAFTEQDGTAYTLTHTFSGTANRVVVFPDANTNTLQPLSSATAGQFVQYIDSAGVQHLATPSGGGGTVTSVGGGSGSSAGVTVSVVNPTTTPAISVVTAPFVASGSSHAQGAVPDPGATAGTTRFLREDGTWKVNTSAVSLPIENYGAVGDATTIFDGAMAAGSAQYGGGTTVTGTTTGATYGITTTASNDVVLTLFSMYSRSLSAVPSGLTQRAAIAGSATYPGTFVGDQTVASAGSYGAVTGTFTAATHWLSGTIALVPTSGNSVSFVNATTATATTTSVSVNVPSGVTAGDYLITCGTFYVSAGVSVVTPPAAFTSSVFYVADQLFTPSFESSYGGSVFQCWAKVASGSEPASYAWTQTSTFGAGLVMLDYRNVQSLDTISPASNILTSPSGGFATASVGKLICAYPAGGSNAQQCGTITAVASPTQVTTSFSSRNSFTNGWVSYGTDNSSAFTTALTTAPCSTTGCSLAVGPYQYALQSALVIPPNTAIQINGTGPGVPQNSIAYINANTLPQFNGGSKLLWLTQGLSTAGITIGGTLHVTGSTALAGVNNLAMWGGAGVGGDGGGEDGLDILNMENVRTDNVWVFNFAGRGYYVDALCCTTTPDYRDYIQTISAYQIYTEFNGGNGYQIGSTTMNNVGNVETIKCDTCVSEANYGYGVDIASNALQGFTWMNGTIQWDRRRFSTGTEWNFESTAKVVGCGVLNNYNESDATLGSPGKGFVNNASGATGCHFQNNFILPARGYATRPVFSAAGAPLASCPSNATQTTGNYFTFGVTAPVTDAFGCSAGQPYYTAGSAYPVLSQQNTIQPTAPQVFTTVPSTIVTVMLPIAAWLQTPTVGTNRINLGYSASTYGMWVSDQTVSTLGLVPPVQAFYSTAANSVAATIALNATSGSPSFVGASSAQATSANNVTVNLPTGTANGNYIVACAAYYDGSVITAPTGFTSILKVNDINFLPYGTSGGDNLQCYYKIAASEPSTYSWTESTTNGFSVSMLSYSNVNSIGSNKITGGNSCNVRCGADGWIETGSTVDTQ